MSEQIKPRPTIEELEKLLDIAEEGAIEVQPNGDVLRLDPTELLAKNYRLEQGRNTLLLKEIERLRDVIAQIGKLARP